MLQLELGLAALAAEVQRLAVVLDRGRVGHDDDVIPQIGSTAVQRPPRVARRISTILARIDSAISSGVRAPMSSPAGVSMRSSSSPGTPSPRSSPSTPWPRLRLATRPT